MASNSDLSAMVGQLLQNPDLAKNLLSSLVGNLPQSVGQENDPGEAPSSGATEEEIPPAPPAPAPVRHGNGKRQMLCAIRPYVNPRRSDMINKILQAAELIEVFRRREE